MVVGLQITFIRVEEASAFSLSKPVCLDAKSLQSCPTLCDPMDHSLSASSVHGDSPGKNTGVGCHALLLEIFLAQGLNLYLLNLLYCHQCHPEPSLSARHFTRLHGYRGEETQSLPCWRILQSRERELYFHEMVKACSYG